MIAKQNEQFSVEAAALGNVMLHGVGGVAVRSAMSTGGEEARHGEFSDSDFNRLVTEFANDPIESLAAVRESLFEIVRDESLPEEERPERLGAYLDAYFDLTIKLDHAAFPADAPGTHHDQAPHYVPDGFVDMGRDPRHNPAVREREQVWVDKRVILERFKPFLARLFAHDYGQMTGDQKALSIVGSIARRVDADMPLANADDDGGMGLGGDRVSLSAMLNGGICRHRYLVFQTLTQAMGFDTRVVKGERIGVRDGVVEREHHASSMVHAGSQWYLVDASNPYNSTTAGGEERLFPTLYKIDGPLDGGESRVMHMSRTPWGHDFQATYHANDRMYWYIQRPPDQP